jgi:uncharacterized sulfatase
MNYTPKRGLGSAMAFLPDKTGKDEEHTDGKVANEGIKLLEENKDKPFFIAIGFYKPHTPYVSPVKYFDQYTMGQITLPQIPGDQLKLAPDLAFASTKPWPYFGVTVDQARECKHAYYAAISFVDAQIGRVLDSLVRLKLWDNTVVVFWSDHGYHLGEHGLWMKQSLFEESARVPMIICSPGQKSVGKVSPRTVELVDLYPTLADLTGFTPPKNLEGFSLKPLLDDPSAVWSHPAYSQTQHGQMGHSVRNERYRYTEWGGGKGGIQLYDHESDPHEFKNLAGDPKFATLQSEMKKLLDSEPKAH